MNADEKARSYFETDILITGVREVEENPERGTPAKLVIRGYIFDFRKAVMPIEYDVINPSGMKYFASLECSEKRPFFTKVWGRQVSQTSYREIREESQFGDANVKMVPTSNKAYDEEGITAIEFAEALQNREVYLATVKQRQEDYQNSKKATAPVASAAASGYNF